MNEKEREALILSKYKELLKLFEGNDMDIVYESTFAFINSISISYICDEPLVDRPKALSIVGSVFSKWFLDIKENVIIDILDGNHIKVH
jgi:hypothetical protein